MNRTVLLTASMVRKAKAQDQEYALSDARQPGLLLRVQPSGAKSWCIRLGSKRITLGPVSEINLRDARSEARALIRRKTRRGREAPSSAITFADLADVFLEAMQGRYAPTSFQPLNSYLNAQLLPAFGNTPLGRFKPSQIADWFFTYTRTAPGGANAALGHLRSMLTYARDHGHLDPTCPDPTAPIRYNSMPAQGQLLNSQQLRSLGKALTRPQGTPAPLRGPSDWCCSRAAAPTRSRDCAGRTSAMTGCICDQPKPAHEM